MVAAAADFLGYCASPDSPEGEAVAVHSIWKDEMTANRRAATGTVLLLDRLGVVDSNILWRFWPAIFCIIGLIRLVESNGTADQIWSGLFISMGALLTLHEFGYIRFGFAQLWPLFLIVAGLLLAWQANEVREGRKGFCMPSLSRGAGGPLSSVAVFGGIERRIEGTIVEGGNLVAFFGGFKIDLSRAE